MNIQRFPKKISVLAVALLCLLLPMGAVLAGPQIADPELSVSAKGYCLVDVATGETILSHNANTKMPMASTTKLMTALLLVENFSDLNQTYTCGSEILISDPAASLCGLAPGQVISFCDLLYGLLLPSGNDAAQAIGVAVSGSVPDFVSLMNSRARELGMNNTHFTNPHGLHDANHYSTPADLALLAKKVMDYPAIIKITSTVDYTMPPNSRYPSGLKVLNSNPLLSKEPSYGVNYKGTVGLKTGFTDEAGYCLIAAAQREGRSLLCVVLGAKSNVARSKDAVTLLNYGFDQTCIVNIGEVLGAMPLAAEVENAQIWGSTIEAELDLSTGKNTAFLMTNQERDRVAAHDGVYASFTQKEGLVAPIHTGDVIGTATVTLDGKVLDTFQVVSKEDCTNILHTGAAALAGLLIIFAAGILMAKRWRKRSAHSKKNGRHSAEAAPEGQEEQ